MTVSPKTIILRRQVNRLEALAAEAITPGHLVAYDSNLKFKKFDKAQGHACLVAIEQEYSGNEISVAYATNDQVLVQPLRVADQFYGLLAANAAAVVKGDLLEADAIGCVRKATSLTDNSGGTANTTLQAVGGTYAQAEEANNFADIAAQLNAFQGGARFQALESVDNSAVGSQSRIRVMYLG